MNAGVAEKSIDSVATASVFTCVGMSGRPRGVYEIETLLFLHG